MRVVVDGADRANRRQEGGVGLLRAGERRSGDTEKDYCRDRSHEWGLRLRRIYGRLADSATRRPFAKVGEPVHPSDKASRPREDEGEAQSHEAVAALLIRANAALRAGSANGRVAGGDGRTRGTTDRQRARSLRYHASREGPRRKPGSLLRRHGEPSGDRARDESLRSQPLAVARSA